MTEHETLQHDDEAFDRIKLRSDVPIRRATQPPVKRTQPKSKFWPLALLTLLFLGAAGAAGFFFYRQQQLQAELDALREKERDTLSNLTATVGTLEEAHSQIGTLRTGLKNAQDENKTLQQNNSDLKKLGAQQAKELEDRRQELAERGKRFDQTKARLDQATRERDQARRESARQEQELNAKIAGLETQLAETQSRYQDQLKTAATEKAGLQADLKQAQREKEQFRQRFEDESQASLRIIKEHGELQSQYADLQSQLRKLTAELNALKRRVSETAGVAIGQLVPYSDEIIPAEPNYRDPLPGGAKIPKRLGSVAVQVLVTETGTVEKAFLIPGQPLDADLATAVIQSIYKWKFTPPTLRDVRVKTWQTILMTAE